MTDSEGTMQDAGDAAKALAERLDEIASSSELNIVLDDAEDIRRAAATLRSVPVAEEGSQPRASGATSPDDVRAALVTQLRFVARMHAHTADAFGVFSQGLMSAERRDTYNAWAALVECDGASVTKLQSEVAHHVLHHRNEHGDCAHSVPHADENASAPRAATSPGSDKQPGVQVITTEPLVLSFDDVNGIAELWNRGNAALVRWRTSKAVADVFEFEAMRVMFWERLPQLFDALRAKTDDVAPNGRGVANETPGLEIATIPKETLALRDEFARDLLGVDISEPQHPQPEPAPSEDEREALAEAVRSWAVAHGFSTDASAFVYEDGESERDIIADLGTLLAAAGFHRTKPEKPQPDPAPSEDEREALARAIASALAGPTIRVFDVDRQIADIILAAGFHRTKPEKPGNDGRGSELRERET